MKEETSITELKSRIEILEETVEKLINEIDESSSEIKLDECKDLCPSPKNETISPPWEREGYETKERWLNEKRE